MTDREWHELNGIAPDTTAFPAAATVDGADVVVFRNGNELLAVQRYCPHQEGDFLDRSMIMGGGNMLRCTLHGFVFRLDTGKGVNAGPHCIDIYEVRQDGDRLQARRKT